MSSDRPRFQENGQVRIQKPRSVGKTTDRVRTGDHQPPPQVIAAPAPQTQPTGGGKPVLTRKE